jgi:hypothetical protein
MRGSGTRLRDVGAALRLRGVKDANSCGRCLWTRHWKICLTMHLIRSGAAIISFPARQNPNLVAAQISYCLRVAPVLLPDPEVTTKTTVQVRPATHDAKWNDNAAILPIPIMQIVVLQEFYPAIVVELPANSKRSM